MATRTKTQNKTDDAPVQPKQAVAILSPSRLPITPNLARDYDLTAAQWRVLVDQIFPAARTVEAIMMALEYCRARHLDIFKRPVHIVPMWSNALGRMCETVWPGVAEIRTTAARTKNYAGIDAMEYGDDMEETFEDTVDVWENGRKVQQKVTKSIVYPEWASVVVWRVVSGVRCPFHGPRVYWSETYASISRSTVPNEMWAKRPRGQLTKCAEVAALRMAFPEELGNEYAAEEMEGKVLDAVAIPAGKPRPSSGPPAEPTKEAVREAEVVDDDQASEFNAEHFLEELGMALAGTKSSDEIEAVWEEFNIEHALSGNEDALAEAFKLKQKHNDRMTNGGGK